MRTGNKPANSSNLDTMSTKRTDFDTFFKAVIECVVFAQPEEDDGSRPITEGNIHPDCLAELRAHAESFWHRSWYYLDGEEGNKTVAELGHDFWFTVCGHGVGFWEEDRWPKRHEMFDKLAKSYPEVDIYTIEQAEQWAKEGDAPQSDEPFPNPNTP